MSNKESRPSEAKNQPHAACSANFSTVVLDKSTVPMNCVQLRVHWPWLRDLKLEHGRQLQASDTKHSGNHRFEQPTWDMVVVLIIVKKASGSSYLLDVCSWVTELNLTKLNILADQCTSACCEVSKTTINLRYLIYLFQYYGHEVELINSTVRLPKQQ